MTQLQKLDAMAKPRSEEAIKKSEKRKKQREYNDLLFQDLCARLPYGVKFKWCDNFHTDYYTLIGINEGQIIGRDVNQKDCLFFKGEDKIKPYLRPMSSMTEEEKKSLPFPWTNNFGTISSYQESEGFVEIIHDECSCIIDWLNKKMFDFRGLIPKDLAISTEEFNPYKD